VEIKRKKIRKISINKIRNLPKKLKTKINSDLKKIRSKKSNFSKKIKELKRSFIYPFIQSQLTSDQFSINWQGRGAIVPARKRLADLSGSSAC